MCHRTGRQDSITVAITDAGKTSGFSADARAAQMRPPSINTCSIEIPPVGTGGNLDDQGDGKFVYAFHLLADKFFQLAFFFWRSFEQQFVVDLQNHFGFEFFLSQALGQS